MSSILHIKRPLVWPYERANVRNSKKLHTSRSFQVKTILELGLWSCFYGFSIRNWCSKNYSNKTLAKKSLGCANWATNRPGFSKERHSDRSRAKKRRKSSEISGKGNDHKPSGYQEHKEGFPQELHSLAGIRSK